MDLLRQPTSPQAELRAGRRLAWTLAGWGLLFAGSPGVVSVDGFVPMSVLGFALWAAAASRPGRRAFWIEALAGGLGWVGLMGWAACVWPPLLLWLGPGHGLYIAASGVLLRRLITRVPLPLAAPLAFVATETVRGWIPTPFGLESYQLGHALHDWPIVATSARWWGVVGLGFVLGALGGWVGLLLQRQRPGLLAGVLGFGPVLLAVLIGWIDPPPETAAGPRVLLVQPSFEQSRKQYGNRYDNHRETARLTLEAIAALDPAQPPDLVCWGETMVATTLFDDGVLDALEAGWEPPSWQKRWLTPELVARERRSEARLVELELLSKLPAGTAFLSGVEVFQWSGAEVRRGNAVVVWGAGGRSEPALKLETVPGAESMFGLERFAAVRDAIFEIAGYVPNLSAGERTGILEFEDRHGRRWRFGATVCFDNAFTGPYTEPLRRSELDFHLLVSNEAWYGQTWEAHQMMAYSRVLALATGRSVVRATNSGVSAVVAPDGSDERIRSAEGEELMVRGTLSARVPVPAAGEGAKRTVFTRSEAFWRSIGPLLALWLARPRRRDENA